MAVPGLPSRRERGPGFAIVGEPQIDAGILRLASVLAPDRLRDLETVLTGIAAHPAHLEAALAELKSGFSPLKAAQELRNRLVIAEQSDMDELAGELARDMKGSIESRLPGLARLRRMGRTKTLAEVQRSGIGVDLPAGAGVLLNRLGACFYGDQEPAGERLLAKQIGGSPSSEFSIVGLPSIVFLNVDYPKRRSSGGIISIRAAVDLSRS